MGFESRFEQVPQDLRVGARSRRFQRMIEPQRGSACLQIAGNRLCQLDSPRRRLESGGANHLHDEIVRVKECACGRQSFGPLKLQWRAFHAHVSAARKDQQIPYATATLREQPVETLAVDALKALVEQITRRPGVNIDPTLRKNIPSASSPLYQK